MWLSIYEFWEEFQLVLFVLTGSRGQACAGLDPVPRDDGGGGGTTVVKAE